jgi:hypothetical protein
LREFVGGQGAEFAVDERQEFGGGLLVAGIDRLQDLRHVGHGHQKFAEKV